jgi:hypothetical protein
MEEKRKPGEKEKKSGEGGKNTRKGAGTGELKALGEEVGGRDHGGGEETEQDVRRTGKVQKTQKRHVKDADLEKQGDEHKKS